MPELYWTKYDLLQFAARHILEKFDISQIKNHNNFWPAGTTQEYLGELLEWIVSTYKDRIELPINGVCGDGFSTYEFLLDYGVIIRLGITSQGRITLLQPLRGENIVKLSNEEAQKLFTILFSDVEKGDYK
ncbi:MAG: hypothetical protein HY819_10375 [Acidobacteria bacterium]|nr:hypothetical protein [Acidobacteriota bacterium]